MKTYQFNYKDENGNILTVSSESFKGIKSAYLTILKAEGHPYDESIMIDGHFANAFLID